MIGYKSGVIFSGNMRSLITTKIIVLNGVPVIWLLGKYEFSPHTVYPGQDLNRKPPPKAAKAKLCRDMSLSSAPPPPFRFLNVKHEISLMKGI